MGEKDSTRTRVVPVFDRIREISAETTGWLARLLKLTGSTPPSPTLSQGPIGERLWGDSEKKLDPPISLLSYLIRTMPVSVEVDAGVTSETKSRRAQLSAGSAKMVRDALRRLRDGYSDSAWFILEGLSRPDAYYESEDVILVVEGKRTEPKATEKTTWMRGRHQMLRHIDDTWEIRGRKAVVGMLIVEGSDHDGSIPDYWRDYSDSLSTPETIGSSLPHRGPEEQKQIADCYVGVATWQQVCSEFGFPWPLPE